MVDLGPAVTIPAVRQVDIVQGLDADVIEYLADAQLADSPSQIAVRDGPQKPQQFVAQGGGGEGAGRHAQDFDGPFTGRTTAGASSPRWRFTPVGGIQRRTRLCSPSRGPVR